MPLEVFETGANRDAEGEKLDYEGFFSPLVLERFAQYMHACRKLPDGTIRDSDNWQLGIPKWRYVKSLVRHTFDLWLHWRRTGLVNQTLVCASLFNAMGLLHESLRDPAPTPAIAKEGYEGDVWQEDHAW